MRRFELALEFVRRAGLPREALAHTGILTPQLGARDEI